MLLTISTTYRPATDLGYLLHKNPGRFQSFPLAFGRADVFYPVAGADRCTAALMLEIDPVGLVRPKAGASDSAGWLQQYVNDRPYVASSHLSVAIASVFNSALAGNSRDRPELAQQQIPLEARLPTLPSREGPELIRRLFEPLGYAVEIQEHPPGCGLPWWGASPCFGVDLQGVVRLRDLLAHLYVLLPVLDDAKHYWVGDDEVDKLLRFGAGWLGDHPQQELISTRYLKRQRSLVREALDRLSDDGRIAAEVATERGQQDEERLETPLRLGEQRVQAVLPALREVGATSVLDLGCGEGNLLRELLMEPAFRAITGVDVSHRALETAHSRLRLDDLPAAQRGKDHTAPGVPHLPGPTIGRIRRRGGHRGHRAYRPGPAGSVRSRRVRRGAARRGDHHHAQLRVQRAVRRPAARRIQAPGSPLRVDAGTIPGLGPSGCWSPGLRRAFPGHRRRASQLGRADPDGGIHPLKLEIPELCLVALVGPSGSGKSTFAARHFKPTEVVSSDACRAMVADDPNDQAATPEAFALLNYIASTRLRTGRLTVIDATSVQPQARRSLVELAREHDCLPVAIVLNMPESLCLARNRERATGTSAPTWSASRRSSCAVRPGTETGGVPLRLRVRHS